MTDATPKAKRVQTPAQKAAFERMRAARKAGSVVVDADPTKKPKPKTSSVSSTPADPKKDPDGGGWFL